MFMFSPFSHMAPMYQKSFHKTRLMTYEVSPLLSSYVTMNTVLAALNLMNVISYLLCIDSSVDNGKDSTE